MSKNRVLLSALTAVAVVCMAGECATAQLFSGRLLGRFSNNSCCAPAPVPTCCGGAIASTPYVSAPVVSSAVPTPAVAPTLTTPIAASPAPVVVSTPIVSAPIQMAAPVVSNCCGGSMVVAPQMTYGTAMPMESTVFSTEPTPIQQGVVYGSETIVETGEMIQTSPSDNVVSEGTVQSTTTSDLVQPPVAADAEVPAPEEN